MRVSYDWLKTMIDIPEDPKTLSDEYIRTGTEVEAIDTVGESFDHVVTAKVLTKTPHPDSDHMYVCSVDVGDKNLDADGNPAPLQIVCGAQNFEAGDHIVTAMIGAVLPGDVKIKKSKLRGVVSMGMNCSARELGLGGDHSGIMILPEDTPCGMPFAEYVGSSDTVLDCEITPNRPDCLSMIGMARETGAIFDRDFHVELPAIKVETGRATDDELSVEIADEGLCDRYVARIVRNVKVGPSPDWMVKRLNALGVRPHNNIVDYFFLQNNQESNLKERAQTLVKHPQYAVENASKEFRLNELEKDIITTHMFPVAPKIPRYLESWVVNLVDDAVAIAEVGYSARNKVTYALNFILIFVFANLR